MTEQIKEQLKIFEELGFNIYILTYEELVEELLHKYIEVSMACEFDEEARFRKELKRIKSPTN